MILWVLGTILAFVIMVLRQEYSEWAPKLTGWLLRAAVVTQPDELREERHREWEADVAHIRSSGAPAEGLRFVGSLALRGWLRVWKGIALWNPANLLVLVFGIAVGELGARWSVFGFALFVFAAYNIWLLRRGRPVKRRTARTAIATSGLIVVASVLAVSAAFITLALELYATSLSFSVFVAWFLICATTPRLRMWAKSHEAVATAAIRSV